MESWTNGKKDGQKGWADERMDRRMELTKIIYPFICRGYNHANLNLDKFNAYAKFYHIPS